jgi:hypothetical protein
MKKIFSSWEIIPWLKINWISVNYPVLNERAIRAWAWIWLLFWSFAFVNAFFEWNFEYLKILVIFLFIDFGIKIFINPKFSPISNIAKFIVSNQNPEFVWAIQKKFAWSIWFIMASIMIILLFILKMKWNINLAICSFCLIVMYLETSFGICIWCKIYYWFKKIWIIKSKESPACPGWACSIKR